MATGTEPDTSGIEFISPPPSYIQLKCPVCFELLINDPKLVSCCGHHLCGECLGKLRKKSCPLCNETFQSIPDKGHKRIISSLMVYCTNKVNGCKWKGELGDLSKHLSPDEKGDCQFTEIPCTKGCGQIIMRFSLDEHKIEHCPNRLKTCHMCSNYRDTVANYNEAKHNLTCPELVVACPFPECKTVLKRNELTAHMSVCINNRMKCPNNGCQWIGAPSTLTAHMKKSHVEVFSAQIVKVKDEEIKKLTNSMVTLKIQYESKIKNQSKQLSQQEICIKQLRQEKEQRERVHAQTQGAQTQVVQSQAVQPTASPSQLVTRDVIVREFSQIKRNDTVFRSGSIYCIDPPSCSPVELCVYPNGYGSGHGTHISVFLFMNTTPFVNNFSVQVRLFDRHKKLRSHGKWFELNPSKSVSRSSDGRMYAGFEDFIKFAQVSKYLHGDCLLFELYSY